MRNHLRRLLQEEEGPFHALLYVLDKCGRLDLLDQPKGGGGCEGASAVPVVQQHEVVVQRGV